ELEIELRHLASTTFKREHLQKGFEPDSSFYFARVSEVGNRDLNADVDPPPDLIIEVDVTSPSLNRFPIFAAFGVPEVWRYHRSRVTFYRLEGGGYVETASSCSLPPLTAEVATGGTIADAKHAMDAPRSRTG